MHFPYTIAASRTRSDAQRKSPNAYCATYALTRVVNPLYAHTPKCSLTHYFHSQYMYIYNRIFFFFSRNQLGNLVALRAKSGPAQGKCLEAVSRRLSKRAFSRQNFFMGVVMPLGACKNNSLVFSITQKLLCCLFSVYILYFKFSTPAQYCEWRKIRF